MRCGWWVAVVGVVVILLKESMPSRLQPAEASITRWVDANTRIAAARAALARMRSGRKVPRLSGLVVRPRSSPPVRRRRHMRPDRHRPRDAPARVCVAARQTRRLCVSWERQQHHVPDSPSIVVPPVLTTVLCPSPGAPSYSTSPLLSTFGTSRKIVVDRSVSLARSSASSLLKVSKSPVDRFTSASDWYVHHTAPRSEGEDDGSVYGPSVSLIRS